MKTEKIPELEANIIKSIKSSPGGEIPTAELSVVAKINYYRLKRLLHDMEKRKLVKSRKGSKKNSVYWRVVKNKEESDGENNTPNAEQR